MNWFIIKCENEIAKCQKSCPDMIYIFNKAEQFVKWKFVLVFFSLFYLIIDSIYVSYVCFVAEIIVELYS